MKLHIKKTEGKLKKSLFKTVTAYNIYAWYELSEEEQIILNKNPDVLERRLFDYLIPGFDDLDFCSPKVKDLIKKHKSLEDGTRFTSETVQGLMEIEENIKAGAKKVKDHLSALGNINTDDTQSYEV